MGALNPQDPPETAPTGGAIRRISLLGVGICAVVGLTLGLVLPPLLRWRQMGEERALSLSNIRRIGTGALLYAQDWDGRLMPVAERLPAGTWQTWPQTLKPYVGGEDTFENPANPTTAATRHPVNKYVVRSSYALNHRFWGTFSVGPFPLDNLELSEQTALFVEAGPFWSAPTHKTRSSDPRPALLDYGDTTDRWQTLVPYPSTHDGRIAVVAADGHGVMVTVEHYDAKSRHDTLYGRIGSNIYNWNGGHPNGATDSAPRE